MDESLTPNKRMTPEREEEIRKLISRGKKDAETSMGARSYRIEEELLNEIDSLREEKAQLHREWREQWREDKAILEKERDVLKAENDKLKEQIQKLVNVLKE